MAVAGDCHHIYAAIDVHVGPHRERNRSDIMICITF